MQHYAELQNVGQSHRQTNGGKLVMQLKTDVGSELLLTSSSVTHPGLAAVKVDMVRHSTSHADNRDRLSERERDCLKPSIQCILS